MMCQLIQDTMEKKRLFFSILNSSSETEFMNLMDTKTSDRKIYILGLDNMQENIRLGRYIRTKDFESKIIFITMETSSKIDESNILLSKLSIFDTIEKTHEFRYKFGRCINHMIEEEFELKVQKNPHLNQRNEESAILKFYHKKVYYTIPIQDILMITPEKGMHQINIKTKYNIIPVPMSLKDMKVLLPEQFVYSHRSCIVNVGVIATYDEHHLHIRFINGEETDCISESCAKGLLEKYIDFSDF